MGIDRTKSIDYAKRYWDRPCDDGVFWLTNDVVNVAQKRKELHAPLADGWEALFVPDGHGAEQAVFQKPAVTGPPDEKLIAPWAGLADCAHYLSRCLQAGGVNVNERGVASLVNTLQARSDTKTLAERVTKARGQQVIDSGIFKEGDMIGYFNVSAHGDFGGAHAYTHSTMYAAKAAGKGRVTCHTKSRYPGDKPGTFFNEWYIDDDYTYTFIHFSNDDPHPTAGLATGLAGWWKITYGPRTEYYYIFRDGRARYTLNAPKKGMELHGGEGSAYWFSTGLNEIVFLWRKTGTVEKWSSGLSERDYDISVNGTPGSATKLF